jgi:glucose-1-phosphate thymidylyltransferase
MKGIILAGGRGTRLAPLTLTTNKHLLQLAGRPMVSYPLSTLRDVFGITDILLTSSAEHIGSFADILGDGSAHRVSLTYRVQREPKGIADALRLGHEFAAGERVVVILGDNIFDNDALRRDREAQSELLPDEARLYLKEVADPSRFGVAAFHEASGRLADVIEKPQEPVSRFAVAGLYSFPGSVFERLPRLSPSSRGEYEITDVTRSYAREGRARHVVLSGFWSDAGTPESLRETDEWALKKEYERTPALWPKMI